MSKKYDTIIFCDLDGTITTEETFIGSFMKVCKREELEHYFGLFKKGEMTLRDTTETLFSHVKSSEYHKIDEYADTVIVRDGFSEFLDLAKEKGYPVVVISGGIAKMQKKILAPYMDRILAFYSCDLDTSGEYMRFTSEYSTDTENVGKEKIMAMYDYNRAIAIGDNFPDLKMAGLSQVVFARDFLAEAMEKQKRDYFKFETFHDICKDLANI